MNANVFYNTIPYHFSWDKSWRRDRSSQTQAGYHLRQMGPNGPRITSQWQCCIPAWKGFTVIELHCTKNKYIHGDDNKQTTRPTTRSVMVYAVGAAVSPTRWWVTAPTLRTPASLNTQRDRASASSMFPVCSCLKRRQTLTSVTSYIVTKSNISE